MDFYKKFYIHDFCLLMINCIKYTYSFADRDDYV